MNLLIRYVAVSLLAGGWLAADAAAQGRRPGAAPSAPGPVAGNDADYALTLRDPFSPIGYRPPMLEWQAPAADASAVSNVPPPSVDLRARAMALLKVRGILKRGNTYVANVNGVIVKAGDEVNVTVDGRSVAFVIRAISLKRVEIMPRE